MKSCTVLPRWERFYVLDEKKNRPVALLDRHEWMHWMPENELIFRIGQFNGRAAGQTVGQAHFHVRPRWVSRYACTHAKLPKLPGEAFAQHIRERPV
ncbi:HIT family protein [Cupriavidus sp. CuC1]|uniref:HIT family protein n=1 Tax=Cupriavidus sp. CuC1 TaxID=3373131 RepID=UPI0037DC66C4